MNMTGVPYPVPVPPVLVRGRECVCAKPLLPSPYHQRPFAIAQIVKIHNRFLLDLYTTRQTSSTWRFLQESFSSLFVVGASRLPRRTVEMYTQLPFIRDTVDFRLVCPKMFAEFWIVMSQNSASFYGSFREIVGSYAMKLIPRTSLSLIFFGNVTSLKKVSLITCPL